MMRIAITACLIVLLAASGTAAQTMGRIGLASDLAGENCNLLDGQPTVEVHMFVYNLAGVAAVQFAAPRPDCWVGATWLFDNVAHDVFIGDSQDAAGGGLAIAFGACLDSPVFLGSIVYSSEGRAPTCCEYPVVKAALDSHPEFDSPIMVLCSDLNRVLPTAGFVSPINPDVTCDCLLPLPASTTTWGGIKNLYR